MRDQTLSQEQQEIINLLRSDIAELANDGITQLDAGEFDSQEPLLYDYHIHLDHIANALELAGLEGLSFCAKHLAANFKALVEHRLAAPNNLTLPLSSWAALFIDYLDQIALVAESDTQSHRLIGFLTQSNLPVPFNDDDILKAKSLFNLSDIAKIEEDKVKIPKIVTTEMASLQIGTDVRPELLQSLLIELPEQTRQFEKSVEDFLASGKFDDLKQAQRIAHTIKGAANIVSIAGIANLTHFAEDLLETAVKSLAFAPEGFDELLIRTSDCLASTTDFLNRQGPAPEDLPDVIQLLLDWLNRLKHNTREQSLELQETPERNTELTTNNNENPQPVDSDEKAPRSALGQRSPDVSTQFDEERYVNLAEKTAQELLRISGEVQISNNQMNSQISSLELSLTLTDRYHNQIKQMAGELEALIQTQNALKAASIKYHENEIDPLEMERFSELHTFSNRLQELTTDSYETIINIDQQIKELSILAHSQRQLNNDNQHILLEMSLVPVGTLASRFARCVRQTCRMTGKSANFAIHGETLLLDSRVLNRVAGPLMHLLRNAVDHGLEPDVEQRREADKPEQGSINISFKNLGDTIEIVCEDDGLGFNYEKIKTTAVERGLIDKNTPATEALLDQLVLMPGFSTRESATQSSGRGIGLDSAVSEIRSLKGHLNINSTPGKGTRFTMVVPASILTSHALLVQCRDRHIRRTYAIASRGLKQIIYVDPEQIIRRERGLYFLFEEEEIPVQTLSEMLNIFSLDEENISALILAQRADGTKMAIGVDKITASQDLVIKPLNRFSYHAPGVIGATVLGDGAVSPVIDLHELPAMKLSPEERAVLQKKRARMIFAERANFVAPPAALVVDDSLSARRSLAQFVSDIGMEVYTAKDGFDAISVIEEKKPSLMLVDLEMPRMNGLELTAHLRSRAEYQDIPVIMITSRSTSRHKEMARNAGVTTYLTKPWSEDELLSCIQKEIA